MTGRPKGKRGATPYQKIKQELEDMRAGRAAIEDELARTNRIAHAERAKADEMFRRSEAQRNRQVEVINRLLAGQDTEAINYELLEENARLRIQRDDLSQRLAEYEEAKA